MFPWVYGFTWHPGYIIFLGIFFSVVSVVIAHVGIAAARAFADMKSHRLEEIKWHGDFNELSSAAKICRHVFTGEVKNKICLHCFDCTGCEFHSQFLTGAATSPSGNAHHLARNDSRFSGREAPPDRLYHRGHTWVQRDEDGTFKVGLDRFADRVIGNAYDVELPSIGTELVVNGTCFHLKSGDSEVRVLSPVNGEVVGTGGKDAGYYLKVKPNGDKNIGYLLNSNEAHAWIQSELERLQNTLGTEGIGAALADGGEMVSDISENYPDMNWDNVLGEMFLDP